jgi:pyridoxine 5'-phosphate synthase PdxJ
MTTIEKKSLRVGKYVDTNHVDTLVRTYKQERWAANSERIGKEDSLSVWYSVEELEEFIQKAKQCGADGIRMHFGAYPNDFSPKPEVSTLQTIVMVANTQTETEFGKTEKNVYVNTENGVQLLAYNFGGLDPSDLGGVGVTIVDRGNKGVVVI